MQGKVCAAIVTYNPDISFSKNLESISKLVDKIFIIDNASDSEKKVFLQKISSNLEKNFVVYNKENLGIATALNQAVKLAIELGYEWIITLDQDSIFEDGSFQKMLVFAGTVENTDDLGIIAPSYYYEGLSDKKDFSLSNNSSKKYLEPFIVITSGNLIKVKTFQKVGFFADHYFIDYVDYEFCLRLREHNYKIYQITDAFLHHCLGSPSKVKFLGFTFTYSIHSPTRTFFKYRNRFTTYKSYFYRFPIWCTIDIIKIPKELLKILMFDSYRSKSLISAAKGFFSAFSK